MTLFDRAIAPFCAYNNNILYGTGGVFVKYLLAFDYNSSENALLLSFLTACIPSFHVYMCSFLIKCTNCHIINGVLQNITCYSLFTFSSRRFLSGSLRNSGMRMLWIFAGWVTLPDAIAYHIHA